MKKQFYLVVFLLVNLVSAQQNPIDSAIDSTKIVIGSQFNLTLKTIVDTTSIVKFPDQKYFGALEVLQEYPTDTIFDKEKIKYQLIKKYGLTHFDSGRYVLPQLQVVIDNKAFLTDSFAIEVANIKVDTLKQNLYDIKDVIHTSYSDKSKWLLYLLGLVVISGLLYFGYKFWKNRQKSIKNEDELVFTPIEKATIELKKLEEKQLIEKGDVKQYYSDLTNIARVYFEEAVKFPALENTTDELIDNLKRTAISRKLSFSDDMIHELEKVLKQADLVKFAKSKPLDFEIINDRNIVEKTLRTIHNVIPAKTPEELQAEKDEQFRLELERKQKRKKLISNVAFASAIVLVIGLAYWVANSGISTIKNKFFGSQTTEFLTSEWIKSEYGFPPIKIETPVVLTRQNASEFIPNQVASLLSESQVFAEGSLFNDYYYVVSTLKLKETQQNEAVNVELSTEVLLEANYSLLESLGARNILMQRNQYKTVAGLDGLKAFGTFDSVDSISKKSQKMYYEILVFKQNNVIQQVMAIMSDTDPNKNEIIDRVINSVELGQAK